jgi:hypothetical protein
MFSDKEVKPTEELIFSIIKDKKDLWYALMNHLHVYYPASSGDWHYYNDGKQWLFKSVQKKKTLFWLSLSGETFRITFYFGDKALPVIDNSDLPELIKNDFKTGRKYGAIRAVTVLMNDESDVVNVQKLIAIKTKMK